MNILIADDDQVFARVLADALQGKGYTVSTVFELRKVLPTIAAQSVQCILLDLMMGEESSLPLIPEIVSHHPDCNVVVLTGYASVATTVQALKSGATNYLAKPVGVREVLAILDEQALSLSDNGTSKVPVDDIELMPLHQVEWEHIQRVLIEHDGNISATARALGLHRRTLQRKLEKRPKK